MANADAVVVELIADVKGFTPTTNKAANDFDQATKKIGDAAERAGVSVERMAARTANANRNLGRQIADVGTQLSGGQSPFLIIAQQAPQVADALTDMGGAAGKVASFFSGPFGAAILAAGSLLGVYIGKLFEGKDASGKMHQASLTLTDALEKERFATDAAQKAITDYNKSKQKAADADVFAIEQTRKSAIARLQEALATREQLKAEIERALTAEGQSRGLGGGALLGVVNGANAAMEKYNAELVDTYKLLQNITNDQAGKLADIATDPIKKLETIYDRAIEREEQYATGAERANGTLIKRVEIIKRMRDEAIKTERERESAANRKGSPSANDQIGRQINVAEATRIVEGVGGRVTSGYRSTERQAQLYADYKAGRGNLAAPPGSSLHEIGQAVDVAKTAGLTIAKLKRAFEAEGVRITELLDEGDHYHVGFGKKTSSQAADDAAKAAEKAREADVRFGNSVEATAKRIEGLYGKGADTRFAEQFQSIFGKEDPLKSSLDTIEPRMRGEIGAWDEENQRRQRIQEHQIGQLADLYEGLFTGGVKGIWDEFKREGLRTLALLLAKWTIAAFTKQTDGGGFGDLLKGIGAAATSAFGGGGAPRASGGPVEAGRLYHINESASGGRVEGFVPSTSGKVIPLGSMAAASRSGGITVLQTVSVDARGAVMNDKFASLILQRAGENARDISAGYARGAVEAAPGRVSRMDTLGS